MKEQSDKTTGNKKKPIRGKAKQNEQIRKEATVVLWAVLGYFCFWVWMGYGHNTEGTYILGFPSWFFYGGILGLVFLVFLVTLVVKTVFREFGSEEEE